MYNCRELLTYVQWQGATYFCTMVGSYLLMYNGMELPTYVQWQGATYLCTMVGSYLLMYNGTYLIMCDGRQLPYHLT